MTYRELINKHLRDDIAQQMFELPDSVFKRSWDDQIRGTASRRWKHFQLAEAIDYLILWIDTPQGHVYWGTIYLSIRAKEPEYLKSTASSLNSKMNDQFLLL